MYFFLSIFFVNSKKNGVNGKVLLLWYNGNGFYLCKFLYKNRWNIEWLFLIGLNVK